MTRRPSVLFILSALLLLPIVGAAQTNPDPRIIVFVTAATRDGFIDDRGVLDSIKDLHNEVRKRGYRNKLILATNEADAEIVIRVFRRGKDGCNFVMAQMEVGEYSRDVSVCFSGFGDVWGECAEQIVKKVDGWIQANRPLLLERRERPGSPPTSTQPGNRVRV
jgi:hypothetical protein